MRTRREDEQGMVLVNVLMFVAIAAGLVLLMITREEQGLDRSIRLRQATVAQAIARGGELSAIVALRRDARESPDQDYAREPWGALSESGAPIQGGTFDLAIADAEGRFNVNTLRSGEAGAVVLFTAIARDIGLEDVQVDQAVQAVRVLGPIADLRPLRNLGLSAEQYARIDRLMTALPGDTTINLNAADEEMLGHLFRDPLVARRLVSVRQRTGFLTAKDLADEHLALPWGTSFRSTTFWVRTRATIGRTVQQEAALIRRRYPINAAPEAVTIGRWRNAAIPAEAPAFPPVR